MTKATIDDIDVSGKRVLLRVDFNVPMKDGRIVDDRRIRAALPTITALRERGARTVILTHLGRPKGRSVPELSTEPLAARLGELLGAEVWHVPAIAGDDAEREVDGLADGDVLMLENVRFEPGEEANDPAFVERLARLGDIFCNDAFGTAHRAHASTEGLAHHLPAIAGYLMARELEVLSSLLDKPERPLVAIIGGAKVSTKIGVIEHLLDRVDTLWVGGAMASTFYRALGEETGTSLVEEEWIDRAAELYRGAAARRGSLRLPVDVVVAERAEAGAATRTVTWKEIPRAETVVDAGPETVRQISADVAAAATVCWNGPLGIYEIPEFAAATDAVARAVGEATASTVIGGGDLAAAVEAAGVAGRISHISTGGGATLEFLEGRELPGVVALRDTVRR
jgi:phosphoglycerate kinase